jgi:uncharacterized protein (TIGR02145 family)
MKVLTLIWALTFTSVMAYSQQVYETVTIGDQTWMKKNLNRDLLGSICYNNDSLNCEKYGRLYFWHTAIDACPDGFRLPTDEDWTILTDHLGGQDTSGVVLRKDETIGFGALLGGNYQQEVNLFSFKDIKGYYWTASAASYHTAWIRLFNAGQNGLKRTTIGKSFYFSVRCIKID